MIFMSRTIVSGFFLALAITGHAHAQSPGSDARLQGDPEAGLKLARAWCSNCHLIESSGQATSTGAPTFAAIARNSSVTPLSLKVFFQSPHQRMPDLHLSNSEIDDLIAYILSLRGV